MDRNGGKARRQHSKQHCHGRQRADSSYELKRKWVTRSGAADNIASANGVHLEHCEVHIASLERSLENDAQRGDTSYPSLDMIIEHSRRTLDVEHDWISLQDTKSGIALAFTCTMLVAGLMQSHPNCMSFAQDMILRHQVGVGEVASVVFLIAASVACACLLIALKTREYSYPGIWPGDVVTKQDLTEDAATTALKFIEDLKAAVGKHVAVQQCRARWYTAGLVGSTVALSAFAVYAWAAAQRFTESGVS